MPKSERFRYFEEGTDPLVLLIYSLALRISLIKLSIASLQPGLTPEILRTDSRLFVRCRKGLRLHGAVISDRVRDELCFILERCRMRIIAERLGSHRQITSFRRREGAFLLKTPDLAIPDLDAPRSFTLIGHRHEDC